MSQRVTTTMRYLRYSLLQRRTMACMSSAKSKQNTVSMLFPTQVRQCIVSPETYRVAFWALAAPTCFARTPSCAMKMWYSCFRLSRKIYRSFLPHATEVPQYFTKSYTSENLECSPASEKQCNVSNNPLVVNNTNQGIGFSVVYVST